MNKNHPYRKGGIDINITTIDSPEASEDELLEFSTAAYQIKTRKSIIVDFIGQFSNLDSMFDEGNKGRCEDKGILFVDTARVSILKKKE
jgi:hypothetical protein